MDVAAGQDQQGRAQLAVHRMVVDQQYAGGRLAR
jgi:hypothetical protein